MNRSVGLFILAIIITLINFGVIMVSPIAAIFIFIMNIFIWRSAGRNLGKARAIKQMIIRYRNISNNRPFKQNEHYY